MGQVKAAEAQYNTLYWAKRGVYQVYVIEEAPTRRILDVRNTRRKNGSRTTYDLPIPWVYTYVRFTATKKGRQLYETRVFFSPTQVKDPKKDPLYPPYIPNVGTDGSVCWGYNAPINYSDDLHTALQTMLDNFWFRGFNFEIIPRGGYSEAVQVATDTQVVIERTEERGARIVRQESWPKTYAALSRWSVEEVCAVEPLVNGSVKLSDHAWFPTVKLTGTQRWLDPDPEIRRTAWS